MKDIGSPAFFFFYPRALVGARQMKLAQVKLSAGETRTQPTLSLKEKKRKENSVGELVQEEQVLWPLPVTRSFSVPMLISSSSAENSTCSPSVLLTSNL